MDSLILGFMVPEGPLRSQLTTCLYSLPVRVFSESLPPTDLAEFLERLERLRTDALLVDAARWQATCPDLAEAVRRLGKAPALFAAHSGEDSELRERCLRAGAEEFLTPPFEAGLPPALERLFRRQLPRSAAERMPGKLLGVLGAKGGCGATTVACHLALALRGVSDHAVLLADLDWRRGMIGFLMKTQTPYCLLDAARCTHRLDLRHWKTLVGTHPAGVDVLAAPPYAAEQTEVDLSRLRAVLRLARACYDWVVLDLGDGRDAEQRALLDELDRLYLVATEDAMGLYQARFAIQLLSRLGVDRRRLRLVLNRSGGDTLPSEELEGILGMRPYARLPEDGESERASRAGQAPRLESRIGRGCLRLARRLSGGAEVRRSLPSTLFGWCAGTRRRITTLISHR